MALPISRNEMMEILSDANRDVVMGRAELTAFGNPHEAVAYLKRARADINKVLEELSKEGGV
jgi:hypothetical protein